MRPPTADLHRRTVARAADRDRVVEATALDIVLDLVDHATRAGAEALLAAHPALFDDLTATELNDTDYCAWLLTILLEDVRALLREYDATRRPPQPPADDLPF